MKCDAIRAMLERYMDGALAPDEMRAVETHLSGCASCRKALAELRGVDELGKSDFAPMPEEEYFRAMRREIREKIQGLPKKSRKEKRKGWGWIWPESIPSRVIGISAAAAVLFLAVRIGISLRDAARLGPVKREKGMELVPQTALEQAPEPAERTPLGGAEAVKESEEKVLPEKAAGKGTEGRMEAKSVAGISAGEEDVREDKLHDTGKRAADEAHHAEVQQEGRKEAEVSRHAAEQGADRELKEEFRDTAAQKAVEEGKEAYRDAAAQKAGRQDIEETRDAAARQARQPEKAPALKTAETKAVPAPYTEEESRFRRVQAHAGGAESFAERIGIWEQYASSKPDSAHLAMAGRALSELYMLEARDAADAAKIQGAIDYYRNFKRTMGPEFESPDLDALQRELEGRLKNMEKEE